MENKPVTLSADPAESLVQRFTEFYEHSSTDTIARLDDVYTQDVEFVDPVRTVHGLLGLKSYLRGMAGHLPGYHVRYTDKLIGEDSAYVSWEMDFAHKSVRGGKPITIKGVSHLKYTSKIFFHEDCYDLGALVYEHVPLIGGLIRMVKRRMSSAN